MVYNLDPKVLANSFDGFPKVPHGARVRFDGELGYASWIQGRQPSSNSTLDNVEIYLPDHITILLDKTVEYGETPNSELVCLTNKYVTCFANDDGVTFEIETE